MATVNKIILIPPVTVTVTTAQYAEIMYSFFMDLTLELLVITKTCEQEGDTAPGLFYSASPDTSSKNIPRVTHPKMLVTAW